MAGKAEMIRLVVYGNAKSKARPRRGKYGNFYTPVKTKDWEATVRLQVKAQMGSQKPLEGKLHVTIKFYMRRKGRQDIDNMSKAIFDALNGVLWGDDSQIRWFLTEIVVDSRTLPRVEIKAEEL